MASPPWNIALPLPLALAIVLACMAVAAFIVRAHDRRSRHHARGEIAGFRHALDRFLAEDSDAFELGRAATEVTSGGFWTTLETCCVRLGYVRWLRLSRALDAHPFPEAERRALRDESPWRRVLAARRLGLLRCERSRRSLRRAMVRGPELVTLAAAAALARYRDRAALRWVLRHPGSLARRPHPALVGVLRSFGAPGLPDLHAALSSGMDSHRMERAVVEVLGLGRHRPAREALEERATSGDFDVRIAALRSIGRLRAGESAGLLLKALGDEAWQARAQAARALGQIHATAAVPALAARLTDPSWWVRRHAAYALRSLGRDGRAALRGVVASSDDAYARDMANEALAGGFPPASARRERRG